MLLEDLPSANIPAIPAAAAAVAAAKEMSA
jgi:hypothetical protein